MLLLFMNHWVFESCYIKAIWKTGNSASSIDFTTSLTWQKLNHPQVELQMNVYKHHQQICRFGSVV